MNRESPCTGPVVFVGSPVGEYTYGVFFSKITTIIKLSFIYIILKYFTLGLSGVVDGLGRNVREHGLLHDILVQYATPARGIRENMLP